MRIDPVHTRSLKHFVAAGLLTPALVTGCVSDPVAPVLAADVQIRMHVTGGLAGVDYAIVVDGASGAALGESCGHRCSFEAGDTLLDLGAERIGDWATRLREAGIVNLDGTDYGTGCCDRFFVTLTLSDGVSESTVRGLLDLMPTGIQDVVGELFGLTNGSLPVRIAWAADPSQLPADPVSVESVALEGSRLQLDVGFSGGCAAHQFDLVAFGGFMESFPVQVRLALTHDGNDDMCDAFLRRTLTFDLTPLAREYAASYPGEVGGSRRLVVHLQIPGGDDPESVLYQF